MPNFFKYDSDRATSSHWPPELYPRIYNAAQSLGQLASQAESVLVQQPEDRLYHLAAMAIELAIEMGEELLRRIPAAEFNKLDRQQRLALITESEAESEDHSNLPISQRKIIELLSLGLGNKQIAAHLGISDNAVLSRRRTAFKNLGVNNKVSAVIEAYNQGILKAENKTGRPLTLTMRQKEAAFWILQGLNEQQIGERLGVEYWGARHLVDGIFEAIGAENRAETVRIIFENGGLNNILETNSPRDKARKPLTSRQMETIHLGSLGLEDKAIAARLDIAEATVSVHRSDAYESLGGLSSRKVRMANPAVVMLFAYRLLPKYEGPLVDVAQVEVSELELTTLRLIIQGNSNAQISKVTFIDRRTIAKTRNVLLSKLGAKNDMHLTRIALETGLYIPSWEDIGLLSLEGLAKRIERLEEQLNSPPPHDEIVEYLRSRGWGDKL